MILQRFRSLDRRQAMAGARRAADPASKGAAQMLVGRDDVHIVRDDASAARTAPVSAVISTRSEAGHGSRVPEMGAEDRRGAVEGGRVAGAIASSRPCRACQEDCVAILRFDGEANLKTWLRRIAEAAASCSAKPRR